jgi:hypothetical protein
MSFQNLPDHLLQHIYEYDNTYHEIYKKCVNEISLSLSRWIAKYYFKNDHYKIEYYQNKFIVNIFSHWHTCHFYESYENNRIKMNIQFSNIRRGTYVTTYIRMKFPMHKLYKKT